LWSDLPPNISETLEAKYRRRRHEAQPVPGADDGALVEYGFRLHGYVADVDSLVQRNITTGTQRQLRRALVALEGAAAAEERAAWLMREREKEFRLPWTRGEAAAAP
jgi:hypothetical protein